MKNTDGTESYLREFEISQDVKEFSEDVREAEKYGFIRVGEPRIVRNKLVIKMRKTITFKPNIIRLK